MATAGEDAGALIHALADTLQETAAEPGKLRDGRRLLYWLIATARVDWVPAVIRALSHPANELSAQTAIDRSTLNTQRVRQFARFLAGSLS